MMMSSRIGELGSVLEPHVAPNLTIPIFWAEESGEATENLTQQFKSSLYRSVMIYLFIIALSGKMSVAEPGLECKCGCRTFGRAVYLYVVCMLCLLLGRASMPNIMQSATCWVIVSIIVGQSNSRSDTFHTVAVPCDHNCCCLAVL
jgi:hypothetical protein